MKSFWAVMRIEPQVSGEDASDGFCLAYSSTLRLGTMCFSEMSDCFQTGVTTHMSVSSGSHNCLIIPNFINFFAHHSSTITIVNLCFVIPCATKV
jgi:hypothetical protein